VEGRHSLAEALHPFGIRCINYDICLGPQGDLADDMVWEQLLGLVQSRTFAFVFASPPCKSASIARHNPDRAPGPGPLRSLERPWGLPNLSPPDKELVRLGNLLTTRVGTIARAVVDQGGAGFAIEQPAPVNGLPSLLHLAPLDLSDLGSDDVIFDQCQFGATSPKPTCIRFLGGTFGELASSKCNHKSQKWTDKDGRTYYAPHERLAGRKLEDGTWATSASENYPDDLNTALAIHIAASLWGHRGDPATHPS